MENKRYPINIPRSSENSKTELKHLGVNYLLAIAAAGFYLIVKMIFVR